MIEDLYLLNTMIDLPFNTDEYYEFFENCDDYVESIFDRLYLIYEEEKYTGIECGSLYMGDTAKSLFRLLFLTKIKKPIEDMYKGSFLRLTDPNKRLLAEYGFYKYEAGLFFYCPEHLTNYQRKIFFSMIQITCGGFNNNDKIWCMDQESALWFWTLARILNSELEIYPGNNFRV